MIEFTEDEIEWLLGQFGEMTRDIGSCGMTPGQLAEHLQVLQCFLVTVMTAETRPPNSENNTIGEINDEKML